MFNIFIDPFLNDNYANTTMIAITSCFGTNGLVNAQAWLQDRLHKPAPNIYHVYDVLDLDDHGLVDALQSKTAGLASNGSSFEGEADGQTTHRTSYGDAVRPR